MEEAKRPVRAQGGRAMFFNRWPGLNKSLCRNDLQTGAGNGAVFVLILPGKQRLKGPGPSVL